MVKIVLAYRDGFRVMMGVEEDRFIVLERTTDNSPDPMYFLAKVEITSTLLNPRR
jgi:hypothetical protein